MSGLLGIDSETTGTDLYHGAKPFLVTLCNEDFENTYYEWDVNPLTRVPTIPQEDKDEIVAAIEDADELVLQNPKFDVTALVQGEVLPKGFEWPWDKTHDTLISGHLLASNHPHDLTSMTLEYLGVDLIPFEETMKEAVMYCRKMVGQKDSPIGNWLIAKVGLPGMPSAKGSVWKYDCWLPRAVARRKLLGWKKEWLTVTAEYANSDSTSTVALHKRHMELIEERGLGAIYQERLKLLKVVYEMERRGVTLSAKRHKQLLEDHRTNSKELGDTCLNIANSYGYDLTLPKSGSNNSLTTFIFDVMKLPGIFNNKKKKTGKPDLDKNALAEYESTLPARSKPHKFISALRAKRKLDTNISYSESYERFWLDLSNEFRVLHPSLNLTGTDTLRASSSNPNEQNVSDHEDEHGFSLRYVFGPAEGREWWCCDAQNIELRIPAYEAGEQDMIDIFENPTAPPYYGSNHLLNFHTVYPDIWEEGVAEVGLAMVGRWCKEQRSVWHKRCKNGGFAVQYGAVERADEAGTADKAFGKLGCHAKLKARFQAIHGSNGLNQLCIHYAEKYGYVETLPDKTVDPAKGYPLLCTRSTWGRIKPTVPLNYHVQGTACWWMGKAMVRCQNQLDTWREEEGFDGYLVMQVHDELVFDFPAGSGKQPYKTNVAKMKQLVDLMKQGGDDIGIPTPVNCKYHPNNWSHGIPVNVTTWETM